MTATQGFSRLLFVGGIAAVVGYFGWPLLKPELQELGSQIMSGKGAPMTLDPLGIFGGGNVDTRDRAGRGQRQDVRYRRDYGQGGEIDGAYGRADEADQRDRYRRYRFDGQRLIPPDGVSDARGEADGRRFRREDQGQQDGAGYGRGPVRGEELRRRYPAPDPRAADFERAPGDMGNRFDWGGRR